MESLAVDISKVTEFNDLSEFLQDKDIDEALGLVLRLIAKPNVEPRAAQPLIVKLQALSAKYAILSVTYSTLLRDKAGTENNHKKNIYYTMKETLDRIVDAVKYSARII